MPTYIINCTIYFPSYFAVPQQVNTIEVNSLQTKRLGGSFEIITWNNENVEHQCGRCFIVTFIM